MAAVTFAMMPHVSAFLMVKWGSLIGALGAVGVAGLPQLGDEALTAALLQQGAHFEGHLALSQGAILTGLIWGAIVASVIDGNFKNAGGFALAAAIMSAFGIIHGASLHWPELSGVSAGYLISAAFLYIYPLFHKEDELVNENVVVEEAPHHSGGITPLPLVWAAARSVGPLHHPLTHSKRTGFTDDKLTAADAPAGADARLQQEAFG